MKSSTAIVCAMSCAIVAALALSATARAQVPERRVGAHWRDGVPRVDFSAVDLADRALREELDSGTPQTLAMRVYAFRANGEPITASVRQCRVTLDLWERVYRVEIQDARGDRNESYETLDETLRHCLVAHRMAVGSASDYATLGGESIYFAVILELNPLSPDTVHRLRRWLSRPAAGGRLGGDAFFGSFVSLFVNRRIGSAERTMTFHSQRLRVAR